MNETTLDIAGLCPDAQDMARTYVKRLYWANRHFGPWPPDEQDNRDMLEQAYEEAFDLTTYLQREILRRKRAAMRAGRLLAVIADLDGDVGEEVGP